MTASEMNILGKLILGCLSTDSSDSMRSIEALAMAGVDYAIVQVPLIDQPHLWRVEEIFKWLWPFRVNNIISGDESDDEET